MFKYYKCPKCREVSMYVESIRERFILRDLYTLRCLDCKHSIKVREPELPRFEPGFMDFK